jgi:hypothetical protein
MWLAYVLVDDLVATAKAKSLGAMVIRGVMETLNVDTRELALNRVRAYSHATQRRRSLRRKARNLPRGPSG